MSSPKWLQAPSSRVHAVELRDDDTDPNLLSSILNYEMRVSSPPNCYYSRDNPF